MDGLASNHAAATPRIVTAPTAWRLRWIAVGALGMTACDEPSPHETFAADRPRQASRATPSSDPRDEAASSDVSALGTAPPSLRAATIATIQREAGPAYDLEPAEGRGFVGALAAHALIVRHGPRGAELGSSVDGAPDLVLQVAAAGCAGDLRPAAAALPEAEGNRASYEHDLGAGRVLEGWYVSGPLGLEQGFTIEETWGCAGELEVEITVGGARVDAGARDGELALVGAISGKRYRYSDLFATDATGRRLAARMRVEGGRIALAVDVRGAAYPITIDPLVATQEAKLVADDAAASDLFGSSVAIDGDTAVVGALSDDHAGGTAAGSAYVFVRSNGTWVQQAKLVASDAAASDGFGSTVAIAGDTVVVGAYQDDHAGGTNAGSAYVFVRADAAWTQQAKLVASDAASGDGFGLSVAVAGDTAIVGAYQDDHDGGTNAGSAYVFSRDGGAWSQQAKLVASDGAPFDQLGESVAVAGDTVVVGVRYDDHSGGTDAGSAYVFVRNDASWSQEAKLVASDAAPSDRLGGSVAIVGDRSVVGAAHDQHAGGMNAGAAYVFVRSGGAWMQEAKLVASDAAAGDNFGCAVAAAADTVVVGALLGDPGGEINAGAAYVFARSDGMWSQQAKLWASDAAASDQFGRTVAVADGTAIIGSLFDDHAGSVDPGSAYVFLLQKTIGDSCALGAECLSGACVDGVCCDSVCGGNDPSDCQACSIEAGAAADGTCAGTTGNTCSDDDACTQVDTCEAGVCVGAELVVCTALGPCHDAGTCDPATGLCADPPKASGQPCSDGSPCTVGDACDGEGTCVPGAVLPCDDGVVCTFDACDPLVGCVHDTVADMTPCDDGNACSTGDACVAGVCVAGAGLVCDDGNPCTDDGCDGATGCVTTPTAASSPCDDDDACTVLDACDGMGTCVAMGTLDCDDLDPCTVDGCDAASGCVRAPAEDGTPCDGGVCVAGACDTSTGEGAAGGGGGGGGGAGIGGGAGSGGADGGGGAEPPGSSGSVGTGSATTSATTSTSTSSPSSETAEGEGCSCHVAGSRTKEGGLRGALAMLSLGLAAVGLRRRGARRSGRLSASYSSPASPRNARSTAA